MCHHFIMRECPPNGALQGERNFCIIIMSHSISHLPDEYACCAGRPNVVECKSQCQLCASATSVPVAEASTHSLATVDGEPAWTVIEVTPHCYDIVTAFSQIHSMSHISQPKSSI